MAKLNREMRQAPEPVSVQPSELTDEELKIRQDAAAFVARHASKNTENNVKLDQEIAAEKEQGRREAFEFAKEAQNRNMDVWLRTPDGTAVKGKILRKSEGSDTSVIGVHLTEHGQWKSVSMEPSDFMDMQRIGKTVEKHEAAAAETEKLEKIMEMRPRSKGIFEKINASKWGLAKKAAGLFERVTGMAGVAGSMAMEAGTRVKEEIGQDLTTAKDVMGAAAGGALKAGELAGGVIEKGTDAVLESRDTKRKMKAEGISRSTGVVKDFFVDMWSAYIGEPTGKVAIENEDGHEETLSVEQPGIVKSIFYGAPTWALGKIESVVGKVENKALSLDKFKYDEVSEGKDWWAKELNETLQEQKKNSTETQTKEAADTRSFFERAASSRIGKMMLEGVRIAHQDVLPSAVKGSTDMLSFVQGEVKKVGEKMQGSNPELLRNIDQTYDDLGDLLSGTVAAKAELDKEEAEFREQMRMEADKLENAFMTEGLKKISVQIGKLLTEREMLMESAPNWGSAEEKIGMIDTIAALSLKIDQLKKMPELAKEKHLKKYATELRILRQAAEGINQLDLILAEKKAA